MSGKRSWRNFKRPRYLSYWIAAVSYLVIVVLSVIWLVAYIPDLSGRVHNLTLAFLLVFLIGGTACFAWETLQWRRKRAAEGRRGIEDIIDEYNKMIDGADGEDKDRIQR